jgi:hypothetical protein
MAIKETLKRWIVGLSIERPASKLTLAQLEENLATNGQQVQKRMTEAGATPSNREKAYHVIGIERWGQRRMRVALGEELLADRYHGYRPAPDLAWQDLGAAFHAARQDTIALTRQIEQADTEAVLVPHNSLGELSVRGWLRYLDKHANLESKGIR